MARKRTPRPPIQSGIEDAVSSAINNADELKEELQSWYDNLPENFQNGDKGDALQEAIGELENVSEPSVPECIESDNIEYTGAKPRASRADRLDECKAALQACADHARNYATELEGLEYDEDTSRLLVDGNPAPEDYDGSYPTEESERDTQRDECETFADECEDVISTWDNVTFPGMYG